MTFVTRRDFLPLTAAPLAAAAPGQRPNILFLMCDQLNPAVTSLYGGPVPTPNLEKLAARGVTFTHATCPTPFCSPTRASIVTGQYPHRHGIVHNVSKGDYPAIPAPAGEQGLTSRDVTYDSLLHSAGYATHHYGKWHLRGEDPSYYPDSYGEHREYAAEMLGRFAEIRKRPREEWMDWYGWILPVSTATGYRHSFAAADPIHKQGLKDFILKMGRLQLAPSEIFDVRVADRTMERMRRAADQPFSITCSFNWPHDPNVIHSPYYDSMDAGRIELPPTLGQREARFEKDLSRQMVAGSPEVRIREFLRIYYASVRFIDDQVGRILSAIPKNTITVFTSDHGDMAGGHGMAWKSTQAFYDEVARVPLVVSWPEGFGTSKSEAAVSLVDLAPTLLELTGQRVPASMQGVSLVQLLKGGSAARDAFVYRASERVRPNAQRLRNCSAETPAERMIRGGGWKYCRYTDGEEMLYDLRRDPRETRNVAAEKRAQTVKAEMQSQLHRWLAAG